MKDSITITREPGSDIKVQAIAEAVVNPEFAFTLTHIPTGLTVTGKGKQYNATVKKLTAELLERVKLGEKEHNPTISLKTADLPPLRALSGNLSILLDKVRSQADYEPTVSDLEAITDGAKYVAEMLNLKLINRPIDDEDFRFP